MTKENLFYQPTRKIRREYINIIYSGGILNFIRFIIGFSKTLLKKTIAKKKDIYFPLRARFLLEEEIKYQDEIGGKCHGIPFHYRTALADIKSEDSSFWPNLFELVTDPETEASLHRWYWLIYDPTLTSLLRKEDIIALAENWIYFFNGKYESNAWQPYTVSERVSSLVSALLSRCTYEELKETINNNLILKTHLSNSFFQIINSIEYYPTGETFNHVSNNLKGVIIAGQILEKKQLVDHCLVLLNQELEILINEEGFLREGSSHYQLIFTRWLVELTEFLKQAGKENDDVTRIQQVLERMVKASAFFIVDNSNDRSELPLFGDVSPDFDPKWMLQYFKNVATIKSIPSSTTVEATKLYTRINFGGWIVFVKHNDAGLPFMPEHSHEDELQTVIFHNGEPVIIDAGRLDYTNPYHVDPYCLHFNHNTPTINGLSGFLTRNYAYLPKAIRKNSQVVIRIEKSKERIIAEYGTTAVRRIKGRKVIRITRKIEVANNAVKIKDVVSGKGKIQYNALFILGDEIKLPRNNDIILKTSNGQTFQINSSGEKRLGVVNVSLSYKHAQQRPAIKVEKVMEDQVAHNFIIGF